MYYIFTIVSFFLGVSISDLFDDSMMNDGTKLITCLAFVGVGCWIIVDKLNPYS